MPSTCKGKILKALGQTMGIEAGRGAGGGGLETSTPSPPAAHQQPASPQSPKAHLPLRTQTSPMCPEGATVPGKQEARPSWGPGRLSGTNS